MSRASGESVTRAAQDDLRAAGDARSPLLTPFTDRIAIRALVAFVFFGVLGALLALVVIFLKLFTSSAVPGRTSYIALGALIVSLVALGNFVSLFVLFSQTRAVSLASIEALSSEARAAGGDGDPAFLGERL